MKKLFLLIAVCAMFVISCDNNLLTKFDPPLGMGYLTISVNDESRAVVPGTPVPASYKLIFTPAGGGASFDKNLTPSQLSAPLYLDPGTYILIVQALNSSGNVIAQGSPASDVVITAGSGTNCNVTLKAIIGEAGTQGTLSWNISVPSDVDIDQITIINLKNMAEITPTSNYTGTEILDTGYYNILIELKRTGGDYKEIKHFEVVHIYQNLTTTFNITFTNDHFNNTSYKLYLNYNDNVTAQGIFSVYHGGKYTKPLDPTRTPGAGLYLGNPSITFAGWYLDGLDIPWDFGTYTFIGDTTLNAKWNSNDAVDLTGVTGNNIVEQAFNYVNIPANAAAGAYTLLIGSNVPFAFLTISVPDFDMSIRGVTGSSSYVIDAYIEVTSGRLTIGSGISIPDLPVAVSPNGALVLSGNAEIGFIDLDSSGADTASVLLSSAFTRQAKINLKGTGDADDLRSLWKDKQIIKGYNNYTLTPFDISCFDLGLFAHSSGTTPINTTHELKLDTAQNAAVLLELPAAPVTVSVGGVTTGHTSLTVAFSYITSSTDTGTFIVEIAANQTITSTSGYAVSKNITLKAFNPLNPVTIYTSNNFRMFTVNNTLTLEKGITLKGRDDSSGPLVVVSQTGALNMEDGSEISGNIANSGNGGGVYIDGGTFIMNGGKISGNTSKWTDGGGGLYIEKAGGTFIMNGGEISGNTATYSGGGVYLLSGTFTMNGGKISGNTAGTNGGGVFVGTSATSITTGGNAVIKENTSISLGTSNLYLANNKFITLGTGTNAPKANMEVWVQTGTVSGANAGVIVNAGASASDAQYFKADEASKVVVHENLTLKIANANVTVTVGGITTNHADLAAAFTFIDTKAGDFIVTLYENQTLGSWTMGAANQNITLIGSGTERVIQYNGTAGDSMIVMKNGMGLSLGNNITLRGINGSSTDLLNVQAGTLTMQDNSRITGHSTYTDIITVNGANAHFIMTGGSITGNYSDQSVGSVFSGGIYLVNGTVEITGGSIKGNQPADIAFIPNSPTSVFKLSGDAEIGVLMLDATTVTPVITLPGKFTGSVATVHMRGNVTENVLVNSFAGKQIIQGNNYTLTANDIGKFVLGNFYWTGAPSGSRPITDTHIISTIAVNLGVLMAIPSAVTVTNGPGTSGFPNLDAALATITAAGDYTVRIYSDQTMTAGVTIGTAGQNVTIEGVGGIRKITHGIPQGYVHMFEVSGALVSLTLGNNITIQGRSAVDEGSVVSVSSGTFTMLEGSILTGHASTNSIITVENGVFNLAGGIISGNNSTQDYPIVDILYNSRFNMTSGEIKNNDCPMYYAVHIFNSEANISGGTISDNNFLDADFRFHDAQDMILSGSAVIGVFNYQPLNTGTHSIKINSYWTGSIEKLNLSVETLNLNSVVTFFTDRQILQEAGGGTLSASLINKVNSILGDFYHTSRQSISSTHYISDVAPNVGVLMAKSGSAGITITPPQITEGAPTIDTGIVLYWIPSANKFSTASIAPPATGTNIRWEIDGVEIHTGSTPLVLYVTDNKYNGIGTHSLTLFITINSIPYSRTVTFDVAFD